MRDCPVCTSKDSNIIFDIKYPVPETHFLGNYQTINSCNNCGMIFSDSFRDQASYDKYYLSLSNYSPSSEDNDPANQARIEKTYAQIKKHITFDSKICDLGCGSAYHLEYLHSKGYKNLSGIDARLEIEQSKYTYYRELISSFDTGMLKQFDFIKCIGVLEHIYDLDKFLINIIRDLNLSSYFYVEVPDASEYHCKIVSPLQDFNLEHVNHFSKKSMENIALRYNLDMIFGETIYQPESSNYQMPVISCLFRKPASQNKKANDLKFDNDLILNINKYIKKSQEILDLYNKYIEDFTQSHKSIYIWGAGQLALKLSNLQIFTKLKVEAYIDKNASQNTINNIKVVRPSVGLDSDIPILISSTLHEKSIRQDIKNLGFENKTLSLPATNLLEK
ncbi:MAG: methyltransferase domain-containing protein [Candidatus Caenarcaniphilales bacterium]|nr:methyltransferase domain-containing protein [Candidatus Caenarcaniphilales bacterium]